MPLLKAIARENLSGKQVAVIGTVLAGVSGVKKASAPVTEARMLTREELDKILKSGPNRGLALLELQSCVF